MNTLMMAGLAHIAVAIFIVSATGFDDAASTFAGGVVTVGILDLIAACIWHLSLT